LRGNRLEGNTTDNVISNNILTDNSSRSIYEVGLTPDRNIYSNNVLRDNGSPNVTLVGASSVVRDNKGYVTEASGGGAISAGTCPCFATVTHGLSKAPNLQDIRVTLGAMASTDPQQIWVDNIGATTFRVNARTSPGAGALNFGWQVLMYR
jgi:hypothetical protein